MLCLVFSCYPVFPPSVCLRPHSDEFTTIRDDDFLLGFPVFAALSLRRKREMKCGRERGKARGRSPTKAHPHLNLPHHVHSFGNLSKDHMFPIQPVGLVASDKKLGAIGVGTRIGHGQQTWRDTWTLCPRPLCNFWGQSTFGMKFSKIWGSTGSYCCWNQ